jgi:hypothetical protein
MSSAVALLELLAAAAGAGLIAPLLRRLRASRCAHGQMNVVAQWILAQVRLFPELRRPAFALRTPRLGLSFDVDWDAFPSTVSGAAPSDAAIMSVPLIEIEHAALACDLVRDHDGPTVRGTTALIPISLL